MKCDRCGNELSKDAKFCNRCGEELYQVDLKPESISSSKNTNNSKTADHIVMACGILFTLGGFFTLAGGFEMQDINSASGNSAAQVFFNAFGNFTLGLSFCMIGTGLYMLFRKIRKA